ncbi:OsmC family protein [Brackiella oedipodis]|uniref:OsmC family protein n=1 Tax=Brackiella oedipodis TaxID=124225 RepID=UPI00048C0255|nr:OsmC family protein [Brackiella oedipodis]
MSTATIHYRGQLRTEVTHNQSGTHFLTDAPTDNHGQGQYISPSDCVASALASCILTTIGIKTVNSDLDIDGAYIDVTKIMNPEPRRIKRLELQIYMPAKLDQKQRLIVERIAETCPVALSIHPDIEQDLQFNYNL